MVQILDKALATVETLNKTLDEVKVTLNTLQNIAEKVQEIALTVVTLQQRAEEEAKKKFTEEGS